MPKANEMATIDPKTIANCPGPAEQFRLINHSPVADVGSDMGADYTYRRATPGSEGCCSRADAPFGARAKLASLGSCPMAAFADHRTRNNLLWRDAQVLSGIDLVRMRQHRLVGLEDFLVLIGVAIEL